jgi:dinuclear metal center YbgI/SA1388 family protein
MVKVRDILAWLDAYAPFRYAASWDNCGLQVGNPEADVNRVLVSLDADSETLREAREEGCECVVTHHPLLLQPIKSIDVNVSPGLLIASALGHGINVIAAHTCLDVCREGTNEQLAHVLGLESWEPLEIDPIWIAEERYAGMGCVGWINTPVSLQEFVGHVKQALDGIPLRLVGDPRRRVHRVALCSGSGGSLLGKAMASHCDVYVTGDLKYHEAKSALEAHLALIDIGHFASENLILQTLVTHLRHRAAGVGAQLEVFAGQEERDPFATLGSEYDRLEI